MSIRVSFSSPGDHATRAAFLGLGVAVNGHPDTDPVDAALALGLAGPADAPLARISLWLHDGLSGAPGVSGLVGHYEALDAEAGVALLNGAREALARRRARRVLGPMNGSTWRRYRLELPREAGDPDVSPEGFATEPRNPPRYHRDFEEAGFSVVARYESRYEQEPGIEPEGHARARTRAEARGIRLHTMDPERFDQTLRDLHTLSLEAFADNLFYSPLSQDAFLKLYAPFRERVVPGLVWLATGADGRLAGYLFGFPDQQAVVDGRPTRTVCKTIAVAPHARRSGLGGLMLDEFRMASLAFGARGIVHALIRADNPSMRMSTHRASVLFKRYALYGWTP